MTYSQAANLGLNQTLVRSINTSVIALLPVAGLLFIGAGILGAGTLKDLALVLFVGMLAGAYSSICIATPILADLQERQEKYRTLAKRVQAKATSAKRRSKTAGVSSGRAPGRGEPSARGRRAQDTVPGRRTAARRPRSAPAASGSCSRVRGSSRGARVQRPPQRQEEALTPSTDAQSGGRYPSISGGIARRSVYGHTRRVSSRRPVLHRAGPRRSAVKEDRDQSTRRPDAADHRPHPGRSRTIPSPAWSSRTSLRCSPTTPPSRPWSTPSSPITAVARSTRWPASRRAASSWPLRSRTTSVPVSCRCARRASCPSATYEESYDLEYGSETIEVHQDAFAPGERVLIVDDVLATGGTARADRRARTPDRGRGGGLSVLMELGFLNGRAKVPDLDLHALVTT